MAPKIFLTGATGYVGGDILYALEKAHPEYEYTAIVRNSDKGAAVAAVYPKIRLVYGTLEDSALLEEESAKADIVVHTADASDHPGAAHAIAKGILSGHSKANPGFWIHTSGTRILCWYDTDNEIYGEAPSQKPYDDLDRVSDLTSLPDSASHRDVDKIVLGANAANPDVVRTAVVCPPTIYGPGRGPGNQRSRQVYDLAKITLQNGQAPQLGKGLTEWDNVHIHDLSALFVLVAENAASMQQADGSDYAEIWGPKGYFLAENGHHVWGKIAQRVGEIAFEKGYIKEKNTKPMSLEEAQEAAGLEAVSWGLNSKGYAKRARKFLGWKPQGDSLEDELETIVVGEAKKLGIEKGYKEKAAGA
ncbi:nucleoside-diphosphate-sugar epimerase [Phlyctema vagabunda]|uniref:Nucleoside-diphosphate-sugar epimerase n=1 Tax=Phlyctema vagabunda TaxID=108571 RepID=A0ABR4P8Y9_9HELO